MSGLERGLVSSSINRKEKASKIKSMVVKAEQLKKRPPILWVFNFS